MIDDYEPQRLFESPEAPPVLRALLVRAHDDVPSAAEKALLVRAATEWRSEKGRATSEGSPRVRWGARLVRHATKLSSVAVVSVGLGVGAGALYLANVEQKHTMQQPEVIGRDVPVIDEERGSGEEAGQPRVDLPQAVGTRPARAPRAGAVARSPHHGNSRRTIAPESGDDRVDKVRSMPHVAGGIQSRGASTASSDASDSPAPESRQFGSPDRPIQEEMATRVGSPPRQDAPSGGGGSGETTLLRAARQALVRSPERTLSLTDEHRRRYPHGILDQEREALAIEALVGLGRSAEARARARAFDHTYPDSPHRARIGQALVR